MTLNEIIDMLHGILYSTGLFHFSWKLVVMWGVGGLFIYLAIAKKFEPLLLLPIGFGIFIVNFPLVPLMGYSHGHAQLLQVFYH
jgi:Na+-transporting methylmalonyl-CoA/oxaloacetate decarboxylase beta subunit